MVIGVGLGIIDRVGDRVNGWIGNTGDSCSGGTGGDKVGYQHDDCGGGIRSWGERGKWRHTVKK